MIHMIKGLSMKTLGVGDVVYFETYTDGSEHYQLLARGTGIVYQVEELLTGGYLYSISYIDSQGKTNSTAVCQGNSNFCADTICLLEEMLGD